MYLMQVHKEVESKVIIDRQVVVQARYVWYVCMVCMCVPGVVMKGRVAAIGSF